MPWQQKVVTMVLLTLCDILCFVHPDDKFLVLGVHLGRSHNVGHHIQEQGFNPGRDDHLLAGCQHAHGEGNKTLEGEGDYKDSGRF